MSCHHPGPWHNTNMTRTNTIEGNTASLHRMIPPSAYGCVPSHLLRAPNPAMWQQPTPPVSFTPMMATMHPMIPMTPYLAINYMGHQFRHRPPQFNPPPPAVAPPTPPPTPPAGMMRLYYNPYPQPPNFQWLKVSKVRYNTINTDVNFTLPCLTSLATMPSEPRSF